MPKQNKQTLCAWFVTIALGMVVPAYAYADQCEQCQSPATSWNEAGIQHLIARIGWAAQQQDFSGRYIISQTSEMLALHTSHVFTDETEYELVTTLTGEKRQVFRKGDEYYSIDSQAQKVLFERQSMVQLFPFWGRPGYGHADLFYRLSLLRTEHFLNRNADVIHIIPDDDLRFGYKVWLDQDTGLLLRLEIEEKEGVVLQRFSFTDIDLKPATQAQKEELAHYLEALEAENYQTVEWPFTYVSAREHGWHFSQLPQGFEPVTCVLRPLYDEQQKLLQWVFSDGVASVSVFIEPQAPESDNQPSILPRNGATHGIVYPLEQWRITLVGEVPEKTLQEFALTLHRVSEQ